MDIRLTTNCLLAVVLLLTSASVATPAHAACSPDAHLPGCAGPVPIVSEVCWFVMETLHVEPKHCFE